MGIFGQGFIKDEVPSGWNKCQIISMEHCIKENSTQYFSLKEAEIIEGQYAGKKIMYNVLPFMYRIRYKDGNLQVKDATLQNTYYFFNILGLANISMAGKDDDYIRGEIINLFTTKGNDLASQAIGKTIWLYTKPKEESYTDKDGNEKTVNKQVILEWSDVRKPKPDSKPESKQIKKAILKEEIDYGSEVNF